MKGWLTETQSSLLFETAVECKNHVLELGSLCGKSAVVLAEATKRNGKCLVCADLFPTDFSYEGDLIKDTLVEFKENTKQFNNIFILKIDHHILKNVLIGNFGMVYVDGGHTYDRVFEDLCYAGYLSNTIAIHDYDHPEFPGVRLCADFMSYVWKAKVFVEDGLLIIKKEGDIK